MGDAPRPAPGLCACGCGQVTTVPTKSDRSTGRVAGRPMRFVRGHATRLPEVWVEEDRGHDSPCWIWQGTLNSKGYGRARRDGRRIAAHRVIWEREHGPVPQGRVLDHLCRVHACVNPAHLEPVTNAENLRRGRESRKEA